MVSLFRFLSTVLILASLPLPSQAARRTSQLVRIVINVPANTPNETLYFTGGVGTDCGWRPTCLPLKVIDANARTLGVQFEAPADLRSLEFKVTRGSWNREAADANGDPVRNQVARLTGSKSTHVMNVITWSDLGPLGVTGQVVRLKDVYSPQLDNKRQIVVWLPPNYLRAKTKRYPVLYMHDGQNIFDPKTSAFGVDWDVDSAMTRFVRETGKEAIVVGIYNNPKDRFDEYDYTRKGAAYARFLIDTVKPLIDETFRTLPGRESTFVSGSSMGALISVALVWKHADVFSKAAGLSFPAFIHDESIFKVVGSSPAPKQDFRIYIDHGNWGRDEGYKRYVTKFLEFATKRGARQSSFTYLEFDYHDHTEADWARRFSIPLHWMFDVSAKRPTK